jgi:hypothetical protein
MNMTPEQRAKQREYNNTWNEAHREQRREISKRVRQDLKDWFVRYKRTLKCVSCSENHPACLDFHHINPSHKEYDIALMVQRGFNKNRIIAEMQKCAVLCANCHRKIHWDEKKNLIV